MLLKQVLETIESQEGPILIHDLAAMLNIEPSALAAMVAFWARKGKLVLNDEAGETAVTAACSKCHPTNSQTTCKYIVRLPDTYAVKK
ncbi:MAG: hypothetical protein D6835_04740 [Candidatus Thermofonsia bacterium]|nr:MAG: hypothetical protein D6835_04740 [Candidatus Thermofonsia bacterium]